MRSSCWRRLLQHGHVTFWTLLIGVAFFSMPTGASAANVTGKVFLNTGATIPMTGVTVRVSVNAGAGSTDAVDAGGEFVVTGLTLTGGSIITMFVDGGTTAQRAVTVSLGSGSSMTGFTLIKDTLIAKSGTGASYSPVLTSHHLAIAKRSNTSDADIASLFTMSNDDVTIAIGKRLALWNTGAVLSMSGTLTAPRLHMRYGTIRQGSNKFTISLALTMSGGTFSGGNQTLRASAALFFTIGGGTFLSTSSGMILANAAYRHTDGGTFLHNNGTVEWDPTASPTIDVNTTEDWYNLIVVGNAVNRVLSIAAGDTIVVNNTFTWVSGSIDTGTIDVKGDVIVGPGGAVTPGGAFTVSSTLRLIGTGTQTCTLYAGSAVSRMTINNPLATCTVTGAGTFSHEGDFTLTDGVFNAGSTNITFVPIAIPSTFTIAGGTYTATSGTMSMGTSSWTHTAGGTFIHNNGTVTWASSNTTVTIDVAGSENFYNLTFNGNGSSSVENIAAGDSLIVNGAFFWGQTQVDTGTIDAKGTVYLNPVAIGKKTTASILKLTGTGPQSCFLAGGSRASTLIIANPLTTCTGSGAGTMGTDDDLIMTGGTLNLNGTSITVAANFVVGTGTTLRLLGGETITGGPDIIYPRSTVWYSESAKTYVMKSLRYQNVIISSTGSGIFRPKTSGQSIAGNLILSGGTLQVNGGQLLSVSGSWLQLGGTFSAGTGTVKLAGTGTTQNLLATSSFNNLTLNNGLLAYWKFDEGTGATLAKDSTGNGNNGTLTNGPTWNTSVPGRIQFNDPRSISFDGTNDYVTKASFVGGGATGGSAAFWLYYRASTSGNGFLTASSQSMLIFDSGGGVRVGIYDANNVVASVDMSDPSTITLNQWVHFVVTYDTNGGRLYRNGAQVAQDTTGTGAYRSLNASTIYIGSDRVIPGRYINGMMDDVRLYNRALSSSEVVALYNGNQTTGSGTYILGSALTLNGSLIIASGTLDVSSSNLGVTIAGNLMNVGGFTKRAGTVTLNGSGNQTVSGSTVFNNFTITTSTARTILFDYTGRQSISGALTLQGNPGNVISIRSTKTGSAATLILDGNTGTQVVEYLNVKDSNAAGGITLVCLNTTEGCSNSGNNTNWTFSSTTYSVTGKVYINEGITTIASGRSVAASINGVAAAGTATTDAGGQYSISGLAFAPQSLLTLYLDGATEKAVTVTTGSGGNMTGVNLYQNRLIVRSGTGTPVSNGPPITASMLDTANDNGDTDITTFYTNLGSDITVANGRTLYIWTGSTLSLDGALTVGASGQTAELHLNGNLIQGNNALNINGLYTQSGGTFTAGTTPISVAGSWIQTNGTFVAGAGTVLFDGVERNQKINARSSFNNATFNTGLIGYWKLDEGTGSLIAKDSSGNGNNGTLTNGPTWSTNVPGNIQFNDPKSLHFDGNDDYVLKTLFNGGNSSQGSVAFWVYYRVAQGNDGFFGSNSQAPLIFDSGGRVSVGIWDPALLVRYISMTDSAIVPLSQWTFYTVTYDANGGRLYRDGALTVTDSTGTGTYASLNGTSIFLGNDRSIAGRAINGMLDDVRIYNYSLSSSEVATLYSGNPSTGSGTYTLGSALTVGGNLNIQAGTLDVSGSNYGVSIAGNFMDVGGFTKRSGTITFNGSGNQTISGSTVFNNLSITTSTARTIFFDFTGRQSVSGSLVLNGIGGNLLSIRSTKNGSGAALFLDNDATQSSTDLQYLNIKDADASGGQTLVCITSSEGCVDSGNNVNWLFTGASYSITGKTYSNTGATTPLTGVTVAVSLNGAAAVGSAAVGAGGQFTISGLATGSLTGGTIITLYIDGATQKAVTVSTGSGGSMTGMVLIQNNLIVRSGTGTHVRIGSPLTSSLLDIANNNGDTDITALYTNSSQNITVASGKRLYVWTGSALNLEGTLTTGYLHINGNIGQSGNAVTVNNNLTMSGGTFTGGSATIDDNGSFTLDGGTFISTTGNFQIATEWMHTSGGSFAANSGTVILDSAAASTIDVNVVETFYNFQFNRPNVASTLASGDTLLILGTLNPVNGYLNGGTLEARGDISMNLNYDGGSTALLLTGTANQQFDDFDVSYQGDFTINKPSGTVSTSTDVNLDGNVSLLSGTFVAPSGTLSLSKNWNHAGGTFTHNNGTVNLDSTLGNQTLSGSTLFNNVSATSFNARTIFFDYTARQSLSGSLVLKGVSGNILKIRSTKTGTQARLLLDADSTQNASDFEYLDVKDSDASGGQALVCLTASEGCIDSGNNTNWTFVAAVTYSLTGKVYSNTGATTPLTGVTVAASLNGGAAIGSAVAGAGGQFSITGLAASALTGGTIVTLYIDGATQKAVTVSTGSGGSMTGMTLVQNNLIVRSGTGTHVRIGSPLTSSLLDIANNNGDTDITALYTNSSQNITVITGKRLYVWTGSALNLGGTLTTSYFHINGNVSQGSNAVTINTALTMSGGTFRGGSSTIDDNGSFTLGGGTFISTTGNLQIGTDWYHTNAGTFASNNGTVILDALSGTVDVNGTETFYHLQINENSSSGFKAIATGDTLLALGTLTFTHGYFLGGTVEARGDIYVGSAYDTGFDSTTSLLLTGTANQIFGSANGILSALTTVNKASGTVTGSGTLNLVGGFTLLSGTFTASPGTTNVGGDWTHTAGGTFNHNNGTVSLNGVPAVVDVISTETFYNLQINTTGASSTKTVAAGDTLLALGTLSLLRGKVDTGTLEVRGDVSIGSNYGGGNAPLLFTGTADQLFTDASGGSKPTGQRIINKPSGKVLLASSMLVNSAGQDLILSGGTLDLNGNDLTVNDQFIVGTGTTLRLQGNEIITGGPDQIFRNATVWYDASVGTNLLKTMNYQNLVISSTGSGIFRPKTTGHSIGGNLFLSGGTLQVNGGQPLSVSGSWIQTGGTFTAGTGTVMLGGAATTQTLTATSSFNNLSLNNGLLLYWKLDEGTGSTIAKDSSGNGNDGTLTNGPTWNTSTPGNIQFNDPKSLHFDGIDDYVTKTSFVGGSSAQGSASFWLYYRTSVTANGFFMSTTQAPHMIDSGGRMRTQVFNPSGVSAPIDMTDPTIIPLNQWVFFAMTYDTNGGRLYRDGVQVQQDTTGTGAYRSANGSNVFIGSDRNIAGRYMNGMMDDVRLYNRALSSSEVTALYNGNQSTGSGTYTLGAALTVSGNLNIYSGTLDVSGSSYGVTIAGNMLNAGGFTRQSGTVTFNGSGNQTLSGSTVFNNLSITTSTARTIFFDYTGRQSASGSLTLRGIVGNVLSIRSTKNGAAANIVLDGDSVQLTTDFAQLDVKDSNAAGGQTLNCFTSTEGCTDSGNNTNWSFAGVTTYSLSGKVYSNTGATTPMTSVTVAASLNAGATIGSAAVDAGGQFSITGIAASALTGGTIVTLWVDGGTAAQKAVTVSLGSGSSMTGFVLIKDTLIAKSNAGVAAPVLTSHHLAIAKLSNSADSDISSLFSTSSNDVTIATGKRLALWNTGAVLSMSGTLTAPRLHIQAGTFRQGSNKLTISTALTQSGGTFGGGTQTILMSGNPGFLSIRGGTFTATSSGILIPRNTFTYNGGTFNHNNGTIIANPGGGLTSTFVVPGGILLNNLTINGGGVTGILNVTAGQTVTTAGTLWLLAGGFDSGTINAQGPVTHASTFGGSSLALDGTIAITTGSQTVNLATGMFPGLYVNAPGVTVNMPTTGSIEFGSGVTLNSGTIDGKGSDMLIDSILNNQNGLNVTGGTFIAPSSTLSFVATANFLLTVAITGGTFNHNNGTVIFDDRTGPTTQIFANLSGNPLFNNVTIFGNSTPTALNLTAGQKMHVNGLTIFHSGQINTGTLDMRGDLVIGSGAAGGSTAFLFSGTGTQILSNTGGTVTTGTWTIAKPSGVLTLIGSALTLNTSGQDFFLTGGTLNLNGNNLTVNDQFIVGTGTTLRLHGSETLSGGPDQIYRNATVWYDASAGTNILKTMNYQNLVISSTGSGIFRPKTIGQSIGNNLFLSGGTLQVNGGQPLSVSGAWIQSGGTFTAGTGTVLLTGTGTTQTLKTTSSFNNLSLNNGLLRYFKFDEGTGSTVVRDSSGTGTGGNLVNGPTWSTSVPSRVQFSDPKSLHFDGSDDYVIFPTLTLPTSQTITGWINAASITTLDGIVHANNTSSGIRFVLGTLEFYSSGTNRARFTYPGTSQWVHFAFTKTGTADLTGYINGVATTPTLVDGTIPDSLSNINGLGFDRFISDARVLDGFLDDVRFYNRALSSSEVAALYNGNQSTGSGTYVLGSALTVAGNLAIQSGTLDASASNYGITIAGNFLNAGGFTKRSGSVTFNGSGNQTISGSTVFHNFTAITSTARTIFFDYTGRQSASGSMALHGIAGNVLSIRSTKSGSGARILLDGDATQLTTDFAQLSVKDSNATGGQALNCFTASEGCTDSGNNTNWIFVDASAAPPRNYFYFFGF